MKRWIGTGAAVLVLAGCGQSADRHRVVGALGGEWDWHQTCEPQNPQVRQFGRLLTAHRQKKIEGTTWVIWKAKLGDVLLTAPVHSPYYDNDGGFFNNSAWDVTVSAHC